MNINSFNFLRWDSNPATSDSTALPNGYILERDRYPYMPVLVPGESLNFYINTSAGVTYADFETLTLDLVKGSTVVQAGIGTLQQDVISVTNYNIYSEVTIPALDNGIYQLVIRNAAEEILLTSNYVRVMNSGYEDSTALFRFTNNIDLYYVRFSELSEFYQQFRLHITEIDVQYEQNREQYQSVTTGRFRDLLATDQEFMTFETYYFDKEAHKATACMLGHSAIYINDKVYTFKSGYKYTPIVNSLLTKGSFEMWNPEFVVVNKCG